MADLMLGELRDLVHRTLEVVQDSKLIDASVINGISFALRHSSMEIGGILNAVLINHSISLSDECVSILQELHICLTHMVLEWESCHLQISNGAFGRPRISINIPLVL